MDRINIGTNSDGSPRMLTIDGTLRRELDKVKPRVVRGGWDYFALAAGIPGCLSGDTKIRTSRGDRKVKDIINRKVIVESLNIETGEKEDAVADVFFTGEKQLYEIETEDGRKIKATKDHIFFIKRDEEVIEIKLSDLKSGDELICGEGMKTIKIKSIKKKKIEETYDLKVYPNNNFFLSNGILTHNSGKSTLMRTTIAPYLGKTLEDIKIVFTAEEFIEVSNNCPDNSVIIVDEGFADWNSRQATRNDFLKLINHAQLIRQKHLYILICLPNFFDLSKTIAIFRSSHLFVTYANDNGKRGYFLAFGRDKKRELFIKGSKYMDYNCVKANFVGNFRMNKGLMDDEAYEKQKKRHLLEQGKSLTKPNEGRVDRAKFITENAIINLKRKGFKQKEMAQILGIGENTVSAHWLRLKRDRKIPPDLLL